MNEKNKRTLAKEVLYFFFGIFCTLVFWGVIETKNYLLNNKIESITHTTLTLTKQIDSLSTIDVVFDNYHSYKLKSNINKMHNEGYSDADIDNMIDAFEKKFGRKETNLKINQLKNAKILLLKNYKNAKSKLIDYNEKIQILICFILIIMGIIYPLRLAYYSLKWSIRTLKFGKY
jgi:hypothetical protein